MMETKAPYDLEQVYYEQIAPLMTQIIGICREHKLPMFATFQYAVTEDEKHSYCTTNLLFGDERLLTPALKSLQPTIYRASTEHFAAFTITTKAARP